MALLFQEKLSSSLSSSYSSFHSLPRIYVPEPPRSRIAVTRSRSICRASWQEVFVEFEIIFLVLSSVFLLTFVAVFF